MNNIHSSFKHGNNFKIGDFCVIEEGVLVGDNVEISNYAYIKRNTVIGDNTVIGSYVRTGDDCVIGNNVTVKTKSTISPNTVIKDNVFIGPNVTILHADGKLRHYPSLLCKGAFLGSCSVVGPNVTIGENVVLASMSYAHNDCLEEGLYAGAPARKKK